MNKKGVSLVILIITVIVLLIVSSITIMQFNDLSQDAKAMKAINEMLIIQSKVQIEMENAKGMENYEYPGYKYKEEELNHLPEEYEVGEDDKWYFLDKGSLITMGIYGVDGEYNVNYSTGEVISEDHIIIDGEEYYKLSDLLEVYEYIEL